MSDDPLANVVKKVGRAHFDSEGVLNVVWLSENGTKGPHVILAIDNEGNFAASTRDAARKHHRSHGKFEGKWPAELDTVMAENDGT